MTVHGDTGTFTINSVKLRQVTGGPNHGLMAVTSIGSFNYIGRGGATAEPYEETVTYAFDAWDSLPALAAQDISGKSFGGAPVLSAVPSTGLSRIAFAANGTAVMLEQPGMSVNWSIVDGKLHLVFGNGTVYDMARATNLSLNTQRWLVRYSTPTEMRTYGVNMVEMQPGLAFSAAQAAQTWSLGISDLSGAYFIKLRADLNGPRNDPQSRRYQPRRDHQFLAARQWPSGH